MKINNEVMVIADKTMPVAFKNAELTYNAGKNIFLSQGYTSQAGNTYFQGVRFSERIIITQQLGQGYAYTFLNGIRIFGKYCLGRTPWQTWKESLHLTKNKMLKTQFRNDVFLHLTGEAESGSGGDQPARNILSAWNGHGGLNEPQFKRIIPRENTLENALPV